MSTAGTPRRYPFSRNRLDPDPLYAQLQREEPVCRVQLPYGRPAWLATTYEFSKVVLGDPRFTVRRPWKETIPARTRSTSVRSPRAS
jgi:hypothetical protein